MLKGPKTQASERIRSCHSARALETRQRMTGPLLADQLRWKAKVGA